jgi:hypothetical protein
LYTGKQYQAYRAGFYHTAYNEIHWHVKIFSPALGFVSLPLMRLIPLSSGQVIIASYFFRMHVCHGVKLPYIIRFKIVFEIQNNLHSILNSPNINPVHHTITDLKRKRKPYPIRFCHDNSFWKNGIMKAKAKLVTPK